MDSYSSVMDVLGCDCWWTQHLHSVRGHRRNGDQFLKLTFAWRDLQSMVASSARPSMVLDRSDELQGHLQDEWQWGRHALHSQFTSRTELPNRAPRPMHMWEIPPGTLQKEPPVGGRWLPTLS